MNWFSRFQKMVKELKQHAEVELLNFNLFPPIENDQVGFLEKKYDLQLPTILWDLYRFSNGLQLRWMLKNNENFSTEKYQKLMNL